SLFSFNTTAPTDIYTLSLHDALPIYLTFFSITIASSTSQSTFVAFFGITRGSFGPTSADVALKKITGSLGISIPLSSAWSRKFSPMHTILLGRQIGGPKRTDLRTRSGEAPCLASQFRSLVSP